MKRHREEIQHKELLAGITASTVANFSLGAPKNPTKPSDFMPSERAAKVGKTEASPKNYPSRRVIADQVRKLFQDRIQQQG